MGAVQGVAWTELVEVLASRVVLGAAVPPLMRELPAVGQKALVAWPGVLGHRSATLGGLAGWLAVLEPLPPWQGALGRVVV